MPWPVTPSASGESSLEAPPLVGGDAVGEEARVAAELRGEPLDRLDGRTRLAALDLRDVFLGEPLAGELALGQPGGNAKLP